MSYTMEQTETQFFMDSSNLEPARKAILAAMSGFDWFKKRNALTLESAVAQCDWSLEFDDDDNVTGIEHLNEYEGQEKKLFVALAPYVKPGSYIQMRGEDGELWRWYFDGTTCTEQEPAITW